jgi:hypothetical protein
MQHAVLRPGTCNSVDLAPLRALSRDRLGDVLIALGAKTRGAPDRGRATAPDRETRDFNLAYGSGCVTDHVTGKTTDALGLIAGVRGLDLRCADDLREAASELAFILGTGLEEEPRRPPSPNRTPPHGSRDAARLWATLPLHDLAGERYLASRALCLQEWGPTSDLFRFNIGRSGDWWLDARAAEGFRVAFPVRRADGAVHSLSLRFAGEGEPPAPWPKTISLPGCSTAAAAVCQSNIVDLASGDPEFANDELVIVEGGPDCVAATLAFATAYLERLAPPAWSLGAIGVASVPGVLTGFESVVRGRVVHIALDQDERGEAGVLGTAEAAWAAGARRVTRMRPPHEKKDIAEAWEVFARG